MEATAKKNVSLKKLESWWGSTDFRQMGFITGLRQYEYSPEEGYQEFVDACDTYWDKLSKDEKIRIWKEYN